MSSADEIKKIRIKTQIGITSVLGLFCLFILIYEPSDHPLNKWAIGIIGTILGYWLK